MNEAFQFAVMLQQDEMATIQLDDTSEVYTVQRALLLQASDYFQKALDGHISEDGRRILRLPGCDTPTLQLFLLWLYKRALPDFGEYQATLLERLGVESEIVMKSSIDLQTKLVKLWSFGEMFLIPALQNDTTDALLDVVEADKLQPAAVALVYQTISSDMIKRMCAKEALNGWRERFYSEHELSLLGGIPGFMGEILDSREECRWSNCLCDRGTPCCPSGKLDRGRYMLKSKVKEEN
ncbi:hypothetical protein PRZ48_007521 [Zasmidium cellare]|uniref:BTB domain-containing protein n=1 Tax=Zasmidium cellare TaxID=395010 RepID=A0ABR0EJJ6_ZASCE|nr:hypothetical protein PRZ48_007521 [Zasmidium cellare]